MSNALASYVVQSLVQVEGPLFLTLNKKALRYDLFLLAPVPSLPVQQMGVTLTVKFKTVEFEVKQRTQTLPAPTDDVMAFRRCDRHASRGWPGFFLLFVRRTPT